MLTAVRRLCGHVSTAPSAVLDQSVLRLRLPRRCACSFTHVGSWHRTGSKIYNVSLHDTKVGPPRLVQKLACTAADRGVRGCLRPPCSSMIDAIGARGWNAMIP